MRRGAVVTVASVLALALLGLGLGGWYYSDEILEAPTAGDPVYDLTLTDVDPSSGTVTLDATSGSDATLTTVGVRTDDALLLLDGPPRDTDDGVRRTAVLVQGDWPEPGDAATTTVHAYDGSPGEVLGLAHDEIRVRGELGDLPAWRVIPAGAADTTWVVIVHGRGSGLTEGNRLLPTLDRVGLPSLSISMRNTPGANRDPDGYGYYGDTEWVDVDAAVRHLVEMEGAEEVVVAGFSQGASTAMTFLRRSELAGHVSGLVLISPLVSLEETLAVQAADRDVPAVLAPALLTTARWIATARSGLDFDALEHHEHVDEIPADVPVLLTHGADDRAVPVGPTRRLARALGDQAVFVEYPGTGHVREWNADRRRFESDLAGFLTDEVLTDDAPTAGSR